MISVIIPTFERNEPLRDLLGDLARQARVRGEILVVDQNRTPLDERCIPAKDGRLGAVAFRVIRSPPGVVAARNLAAATALGEILLFLDDDVRIDDARFLQRHAANYDDGRVAAVCGQELVPPGFETVADWNVGGATPFQTAMFFPRNSTRRREVCALSTCNCSIRASVMKSVGGFDPAYRGNSYGDDADLALRLQARGFHIIFDPAASVRHLKSPKGGLRLSDAGNPSSEVEKYISAWILFFRHVPARWMPWFLWRGILRKSILLKGNFLRPRRWLPVLDGLLRAMFEGWRAASRKWEGPR